jgi:hypothetical protein
VTPVKRLLPAVFLLCASCALPDRAFVEAVDKSWKAIGPRYKAYLEADTSLDPETRELRIETADGLTVSIDKAKKAVTQ